MFVSACSTCVLKGQSMVYKRLARALKLGLAAQALVAATACGGQLPQGASCKWRDRATLPENIRDYLGYIFKKPNDLYLPYLPPAFAGRPPRVMGAIYRGIPIDAAPMNDALLDNLYLELTPDPDGQDMAFSLSTGAHNPLIINTIIRNKRIWEWPLERFAFNLRHSLLL
jgi:hypothetical protein